MPPGRYLIRAQAREYGLVDVPVVVAAGRLTTVRLHRNWQPALKHSREQDYVWLGYRLVGWRAPAPTPNPETAAR